MNKQRSKEEILQHVYNETVFDGQSISSWEGDIKREVGLAILEVLCDIRDNLNRPMDIKPMLFKAIEDGIKTGRLIIPNVKHEYSPHPRERKPPQKQMQEKIKK